MKRVAYFLAALAVGSFGCSSARAGFVDVTGNDPFTGTVPLISVTNGTFISNVFNDGATATDPSLEGYSVSLTNEVSPTEATGTYLVFYDANGDHIYEAGIDTQIMVGTVDAVFNGDNVTGTMVETAGPSGPLADYIFDDGVRYGGHPMDLTGTLDFANDTGQFTITQTANPVPEPASAGLALGALGFFGCMKRDRRKSRHLQSDQ